MVYKVVVSDEDVTYQLELEDKDAKTVMALKLEKNSMVEFLD